MPIKLTDNIFINGSYLDANIVVNDIRELEEKASSNGFFLGMSVKMPEAFEGVSGQPYPIDFWSTTYGDEVKWLATSLPSIETDADFKNFKIFAEYFKMQLGYYPLAEGTEILVNGEKYSFKIKNGDASYDSVKNTFDSTIDAIKEESKKYTDKSIQDLVGNDSGKTIRTIAFEEIATQLISKDAKEALDTLQEIAAWIQQHPDDAAAMNEEIKKLKKIAHSHDNQAILDGITKDKVSSWDNAEINAKSYTDGKITEVSENFNWLVVDGEKQKIRHWRGTRKNYEFLVKAKAVSPWTKYVVIDEINGEQLFTEYYGTNQVSDATGQLLPVIDVIDDINNSGLTFSPYDRYLVGTDEKGYNIYEYVIDKEGEHRWIIKPFDYHYGVRIINKGLKNFVYVNRELITYDDVDCGNFN